MYNIGFKMPVRLGIAVFVLATALTNAQSAATVQVTNEGSKVKIVVMQTTPLRTVLEDVCRETKAICSGTEIAGSQTVSPMSISGTWSEVISRILDGTGLNYAAGAPSGNTPPQLLIQGIATAVDPPRPMQEQPAESVAMGSMAQPSSEQPQPASNSSSENLDSQAAMAGSGYSSPMQSNGDNNSNGVSYLPFPDRNGRPIALSTEPASYLPFTDNGKLIPLPAPVQSNVLPFPDANGRPIVVNPDPPQYLPFLDNGKLIPWPKAPH